MTPNNSKGEKKIIVWFRKDLRLLDNPSIFEAISNGYSIIPLFIWDSDSNQKWAPGEASNGGFTTRWPVSHPTFQSSVATFLSIMGIPPVYCPN